MLPNELVYLVRELVVKLARGEFNEVVAECSASRLSADDLREVIADYGKRFIAPPVDGYHGFDALLLSKPSSQTWSVRAPLWSQEEGRSDLELRLTIKQFDNQWNIELDDLLVP